MISFQYDTTILQLRNPVLGDSNKRNIQIKHGVSMDGSVYTYKNTPPYSVLLMTFTGLTKAKVEEAIEFFKVSSGYEITYIDYNSDTWLGQIITDPIEVKTVRATQEGNGSSNACVEFYELTIEFSCVKT